MSSDSDFEMESDAYILKLAAEADGQAGRLIKVLGDDRAFVEHNGEKFINTTLVEAVTVIMGEASNVDAPNHESINLKSGYLLGALSAAANDTSLFSRVLGL